MSSIQDLFILVCVAMGLRLSREESIAILPDPPTPWNLHSLVITIASVPYHHTRMRFSPVILDCYQITAWAAGHKNKRGCANLPWIGPSPPVNKGFLAYSPSRQTSSTHFGSVACQDVLQRMPSALLVMRKLVSCSNLLARRCLIGAK